MGRRRGSAGEFLRNFSDSYNLGTRLATDVGLRRAGQIDQQEVSAYTPNQGQELEAAANARDADGNPLYEVKASDGGTYSVTPTAGGETATIAPAKRYRLGTTEQDTPFSNEQIDAARLKGQADVYTRFGQAEQAARLHGLARERGEEATQQQLRTAATAGLTPDMRDDEKAFTMSKNLYEAALRMNRPDLASSYYSQLTQNRDALMSRAVDRAERVWRASGNIGGYVDAYNKYMADGVTIDAFRRNADGSHTLSMSDGTGKTKDVDVPGDKIQDYLLALRDPKRVAEMEQQRAQMLFKARADAQEKLNAPVAVGKDQTLVVPATGQTFAPRQAGQFDVKEANAVLDDARRMILERSGNFDQTTGKWNWSPDAVGKAGIAERLFMKNPTLTPAMMAEIADRGTAGNAVVDVGGRQQRVPAVTYQGRTYLLGGADAGQPAPAAPAPTTSGLGTRSVSGKIAPAGLQRAPAGDAGTADGFPRVSQAEQADRDAQAGRMLVSEAGGIDKARADLAELDAALKNPRLDGTQRAILQGHRNRLAAGIAAS